MAAAKKKAKKVAKAKKKPAAKKAKSKKPSKKSEYKILHVVPNRKVRVLIAKPGLDGHDRGAKVIARALRDAGFEIIYTGLHQTPEMIIQAALEEDVHVVGLSILSGAHNALVPEIVSGIKKAGAKDVLFLVGGIIPDEDVATLKKQGVHMVFTPGASIEAVIHYIREHAPERTLD